MKNIIDIRIKRVSAGQYLATSDKFNSLFTKGNNIAEVLKNAKEAIRILIREKQDKVCA